MIDVSSPEGSQRLTRTIRLGPIDVDPKARLREGTALMRVSRVRTDSGELFGVSGVCCCAKLPFTAPLQHGRPAKISLGSLISPHQGGESPTNTLLRMRTWSTSKEDLHRWIGELRRAHGDSLQLVIWDDTDYEIPWELLWLPAVPGTDLEAGWLGCVAVVTRWTTIRSAYPTGNGPNTARRCDGTILAYIADEQLNSDADVLMRLGASMQGTVRELITALESPGERVALVYVACHGEYADSGFQFKLDGVSMNEIAARSYRRMADSNSLVFVNACHSARLIDDIDYNDATLRGFAEAFLRSGAAGFLGTSGAVGEETAREAMTALLERLRRDRDIPVAVALRDHRRDKAVWYIPSAGDAAEARKLLSFFHTFMYVYYGSPHTTVCLAASGRRE